MQAMGITDDPEKTSSDETLGGTVAFKVMLRRGGRDDKTRSVQVGAFSSRSSIDLNLACT